MLIQVQREERNSRKPITISLEKRPSLHGVLASGAAGASCSGGRAVVVKNRHRTFWESNPKTHDTNG